MGNHVEVETLPGFIGLIHREEGDEILARISEEPNRHLARAEFLRRCEDGEEVTAVFPLALACQIGIDAATAFRPRSQFELEDIRHILTRTEEEAFKELGERFRTQLDQEQVERNLKADTGPFKLTGSIGSYGDDVCWHNDAVKDAEMIAKLMERVTGTPGLLEVPTANGSEINLKVGIDAGFGNWKGEDTCVVRMYCGEWDHLASDMVPVHEDFFGTAIARAGTESGQKLAEQIVLAVLEYALIIYRNLAPYLNDEERAAADLDAVAS